MNILSILKIEPLVPTKKFGPGGGFEIGSEKNKTLAQTGRLNYI